MTQFISFLKDPSALAATLENLWVRHPNLQHEATRYIRFILVFLALFTVISCIASLLKEIYTPEIWGHLTSDTGADHPLHHWENIIGRARSSDVQLESTSAARMQAALTRNAQGNWRLYPLSVKKHPVLCNGKRILNSTPVYSGDIITMGNVSEGTAQNLTFETTSSEERERQSRLRLLPGFLIHPWVILLWITEFQVFLCIQAVISAGAGLSRLVIPSFLIVMLTMWAYFALLKGLGRTGFEAEALAFFLTSIGLAMVTSRHPDGLLTWLITFLAGVFCFFILCLLLRRLDFAQRMRWLAGAGALGLLLLTLVFGKVQGGARNWIKLGSFSMQPSELAKVCFIFAGTATLDRLFAKRNLIMFAALGATCVGLLALMSDFGTAFIFFITFLVIAYMRSGDFASLIFTLAAACSAVFLILKFKPYIADRFAVWRHVWEDPLNKGYQQVRTMSAAASGGLFGMGLGKGWLKNIAASDTDLVFGMVCEELGLIIAVLAILSIITFALFAIRSATLGRSTLYVIAACAASAALITQVILNVCGSVDILPLTGVTFPFVSNGGSSMISAWCMLAFIKAADTRERASIAVERITED